MARAGSPAKTQGKTAMSSEKTSDPTVADQPDKPSTEKPTKKNVRRPLSANRVDFTMVAFPLPNALVDQLDKVAAKEMRSRSAQAAYFIVSSLNDPKGGDGV